MFGFTVIQLDMAYIREEMLPELAERHFIHAEGDVYRVAVIESRTIQRRCSIARIPRPPLDRANADATAGLLGRVDPSFFFDAPAASEADGDQLRGAGDAWMTRPDGLGRAREDRSAAGGCWCSTRADRSKRRSDRRAPRNLAISFGVLLLLTVQRRRC